MGAPDAGLAPDQAGALSAPRAPRRWNRGVWIRFALAIMPTLVFAILGYLQTH
ncbi:MAG TPA: hypothetical protein VGP92_01410 [Acidimicrobiia bacterium]|nr:hypothetical protein [Acidimicrobiia bacterium]